MGYRRDRVDNSLSAGPRPSGSGPVAAPVAAPPGNAALGRVLQRFEQPASQGAGPLDPGIGAAIDSARGGGIGLPDPVRTDMEGHFGTDLAAVRVHTGAHADALNRSVQACAFTVGSDIFFSGGSYDPAGAQGRELLAHELTHVVQAECRPGRGRHDGQPPRGPGGGRGAAGGRGDRCRAGGRPGVGRKPRDCPGVGAAGRPALRRARARADRQHHRSDHRPRRRHRAHLGRGRRDRGRRVWLGRRAAPRPRRPGGPARLRGRLEHDRVAGPIPAVLPAEAAHSNARYVELAMQNAAHFSAGGSAIPTWRSYHENALLLAVLSGMDAKDEEWQQAQLTEAFGQHFLTDSFSAGHVRTPRAQIMAWYQSDFAPRALGPFPTHARERVSKALTDDLGRQMVAPNAVVHAEFDAILAAVLAVFDGMIRERFQDLFGLGISGAISGVLHDTDNERGIWVRSDAHPAPWMAYGDGALGCSPTSREQAELAVITAREQLVAAQALGRTRAASRGATPAPPGAGSAGGGSVPGVVHFGFDSSGIDGASAAALDKVADYLTAHSEQVVDLIGHTCPIGGDGYNFNLGMRRAEAAAAALMARGVAPMRISTTSAGEMQLVNAEPSGYALDRRVELSFRATGDAPPDLVWAQQAIAERWAPPYQAVESYVPQEAPGLNDAKEDWNWGTLTSTMAGEVDKWVAHYVTDFKPSVLANPALDDRTIPVPDIGVPVIPGAPPVTLRPVVLHPRPIVEQILDEIIKAPTAVIGDLVGQPAANASAPPLPPLVPCLPP